MSREIRQKRRRVRNRRRLRIGIAFFLIIAVIAALAYRSQKNGIVEASVYTRSEKTKVYFFKDIDYTELDDFSSSDLNVDEGSKVNGYTALTDDSKVVSQDYLNDQIDTIDQIISEKTYQAWPSIVEEIQDNFSGLDKLKSELDSSKQSRKDFLINAVRYMGLSVDELKTEREQLSSLNDGKSRDVILGDLDVQSSGYVYTTINSLEKITSENVLPYIDKSFLDNVGTLDRQNKTALKVINNDHLFAAFVLDKDDEVDGEDEAMKLKEKYAGTTGTENNSTYYQYLVQRVDILWQYPEIAIEKDGKYYDCYLIDVVEDGDYKIPIVLFKDYVNVFAEDTILSTNVQLQKFSAYQIPQSAITKKDDKTYLTTLEKDYFEKEQEVTVEKWEKGDAILRCKDNTDLESGTVYKVYP